MIEREGFLEWTDHSVRANATRKNPNREINNWTGLFITITITPIKRWKKEQSLNDLGNIKDGQFRVDSNL